MEKLEASRRIADIEKMYNDVMGDNLGGFSALVKGVEGSGKTRFACTGRLPILVDVFDAKGYVIYNTDPFLKQLKDEKKISVRFFTNENSQNPTEYARWSKQWQDDCKSGFLGMFGTYVLDSGTSWLEAMANYISEKKGRKYNLGGIQMTGNLEIQDYIPMYNMVMDLIKISSSQGCDFIYLAHLIRVPIMQQNIKGEMVETGQTITEMDTYSRLKSKIPKLFSEKYCMVKERSSNGVKRVLLTDATGEYEASSQLKASGKIDAREEPDIKKLLEKAGLPVTDKPINW